MQRKIVATFTAMLASLLPATAVFATEMDSGICASRIYNYVRDPVIDFTIDFLQTEMVSDDTYERYRAELEVAAMPFGYVRTDAPFTLHETLSKFPFLNRGLVLDAMWTLCTSGKEKEGQCRRADYYLLDGQFDPARLSLLLADVIRQATPAPVDSCDFGQGDWTALN